MVTLSFQKFRSAKCDRALVLTGGELSITTEDTGLLSELFALLKSHHSLSITVDGAPMTSKAFTKLLLGLSDVRTCCAKRSHAHYCKVSPWGCRLIKSVELQLSYAFNYWYTFGHFEEGCKIWVVHKEEILQKVLQEVRERGIATCTHFKSSAVALAVSMLPGRIDMRTTSLFIYVYGPRFAGDASSTPTGIAHRYETPISHVTQSYTLRLN